MSTGHEFDQARARLQGFGLGPVPDLDVAEVIRRGRRRRRVVAGERALAVAAVVAVLGGLGIGAAQLGRMNMPPAMPSPSRTGAAPTWSPSPSPSPSSSTSPVPSEGFTLSDAVEHLTGGPAAIAFQPGTETFWALESTEAGRPGHLLRATLAKPTLQVVADVGTYTSALAVTSGRVWVVNPEGDPRDGAHLDDTVQEFDTSGKLLHAYTGLSATSVVASGTTAWVMTAPGGDQVGVSVLSGGAVRSLATLSPVMGALMNGDAIWLTADGRLGVAAVDPIGEGVSYWSLDRETGQHTDPMSLSVGSGAAILPQADRIVATETSPVNAGPVSVLSIDSSGTHELAGCAETTNATVLTASDQAWVVGPLQSDPSQLSIRLLAGGGCASGVDAPNDETAGFVVAAGTGRVVALTRTTLLIFERTSNFD